MIPIGTRVQRVGFPLDPYHLMKGTVIGHRPKGSNHEATGVRYNVVLFDDYSLGTDWVEGHLGIMPLDAVTLLGEINHEEDA